MGIVSKELADALQVHRVRSKKYLQHSTSVLTPVKALEPRVMLDATLNLDPGLAGFTTDASKVGVDALITIVEAVNAQKDYLLDGLTKKFREALEPISGLIDLDGYNFNAFEPGLTSEDQDGDGNLDVKEDIDGDGVLDDGEDVDGDGKLDAAEDQDGDGQLDAGLDAVTDSQAFEILSKVYDAVSTITEVLGGNIEQEVDALKTQIRDTINGHFNAVMNDGANPLGANQVAGTYEWLTEDDVDALFRLENLVSLEALQDAVTGIANDKLDAAVGHWQDLFNGATDVLSTDLADYFRAMTDGFFEELVENATGGIQSFLSIDLANVADPDNAGEFLIEFNQGTAADNRDVEVSVDLSGIGLAIQDLLGQFEGALDFTGIDLDDFQMPDLSLDFDLSVADTYNGDVNDPTFGLDMTINGFELKVDGAVTDEIVFGGVVYDATAAGTDPLAVNFGLLEAQLDKVETAQIKLDLSGISTVNATIGFDTDAGLQTSVSLGGLVPDTLIQEVGGAGFVQIDAYDGTDATTYDMVEVAYSGSLGFHDDLDDATETLFNFDGTFGASMLAKPSSASAFATELLDGFDVTAEINPNTGNAVLDAELKDLFEGLATMGIDEIFAMFDGIGAQLESFLSSDFFSFELPFINIDLSDVFDFVDTLKADFLDFFTFDLGDLGLASGSMKTPGFGISTSGLMGDGPYFSGFPSLDFSFTLGGTSYDINLAVPAGGWPDIGAFLAEMNLKIGALNLFADGNGALSGDSNDLPAISFAWDPDLGTWSILNASNLEIDWAFPDIFTKSFGLSDLTFSNPFAGISFSGAGTTSFDSMKFGVGSIFDGLFDLNFDLGINGSTQTVTVKSSQAGGGWPDLASFLADLNLSLYGFNLRGINLGDGGFRLEMIDVNGPEVNFGVAADLAYTALSIDGVREFVNSKIADLIPGSKMVLTEEGELLLELPELSFETSLADVSNSPDALTGIEFSAEDFGVNWLTDFEMTADVTGVLEGSASAVIALDIMGYLGSKYTGNSLTDNILEQTSGTVPKPDKAGSSFGDFVGFAELEAEGRVFAAAENISGGADLGFVEAVFGDLDNSGTADNAVYFDTQIDFSLSGFDKDSGEYGANVTYTDIKEALAAGTLSDVIGRFELLGGVEVNDDGFVQLAGDGSFQVIDAKDYAGGETLAFYALNIGEIHVLVDGISGGITEDAINAFNYAGTSLTSFEDNILFLDSPVADAISGLQGDDILDTLTNFATMLVELGDALKEDLPWLDTSIPLLNFSILDGVNFAEDFLSALQELRDDPAGAIHQLEGVLLEALGMEQDTANPILLLETSTNTLYLDLVFDFLEDYQEDFNFGFDLDQILGTGNPWPELLGSLVDASTSGGIIFDPDISFGIRLGLDMSEVAVAPTLALDTPLAALSSVGAIALAANGGNELKITRKNTSDPTAAEQVIEIDLDGVTTIEEAQDAINAALNAEIESATFEWDDAAKQFVITDTDTAVYEKDGVNALFGGEKEAADHQITVSDPDNPGNTHDIDAKQVVGGPDLAGADFAAEYAFDIVINEDVTHTITVAADAGRASLADLVEAVNAAIDAVRLDRAEVFDGLFGTTVSLGNLIDASEDAGKLVLTTTNYMEVNGLELIDFTVRGVDVSDEYSYTFDNVGGSNFAELLGFEPGDALTGEEFRGETLDTSTEFSAPRAFLDTEQSGFRVDLNAGVEEGLNVSLAVGPISAKIVDGKALLTNNDGSGPAFLKFGFEDLDGDGNANQYDLSHLPTLIAGTGGSSLADFFTFDAEAMIDVDLPIEAVGLIDPAIHGISGTIDLLDLNPSNIPTLSEIGTHVATNVQFDFDPSMLNIELPDLADIFSNFNIFALLNDPRTVLEGLDYILAMVQETIDDSLGGLDLPIVGDMVGSTVSVFEDLRYGVIEPALDHVSTPDENGNLPTTVDVLTDFLNSYIANFMEDAFGYTQADDFVFAEMVTLGTTNETFIYSTLQFAGKLFETSVDIDFDIGIPGLNLELKEGSALDVVGTFDVHLAFGIDKDGFFFINDDDLEVKFDLDLTSEDFAGSFQLGPGLLSAVAADVDGDGVQGLGIFVNAGLDLFTDLGTDVAAMTNVAAGLVAGAPGTGVGLDYSDAKIVRFSEIKGDKLVDFALAGDFEADLELTAEIVNPISGDPITIPNPFGAGDISLIPEVKANLIFDGTVDAFGDEPFTVEQAELRDVALNVGTLYENLVKPIMDVINPFIEPVRALYNIIDSNAILKTAFSFAAQAFPILKVIPAIEDILRIFDDYENNPDPWMNIGDLNVESWFRGGSSAASLEDVAASLDAENIDIDAALAAAVNIDSGEPVFSFPILTDPMNALGILLGNYDEVELVNFNLALIDFGFSLDTDDLLGSLGLPGWVADRISSAIRIVFGAEAYIGIQGGYDLGGVMGFIDTLDPARLLDGFYIDTTQDLIEFAIDLIVELNINLFLFEAGMNLSSNVYFNLGLNDPNDDGKLRIQEIGDIFEAYIGQPEDDIGELMRKTLDKVVNSDIQGMIDLFELLFEGGGGFDVTLGAYAQLNGWLPIKGKFKIVGWSDDDLIKIGYDFTFGKDIPEVYVKDPLSDFAELQIGAMFQDSNEANAQDVSDKLVLNGPNSPIDAQLSTSSGKNIQFDIKQEAHTLVAHLGQGNNEVDAKQLKNRIGGSAHAGLVLSFGDGNDVINLPEASDGFALVFAGDGDDVITGGDGDYYIFAGEGNDEITLGNGNNLVFGANSHGIETALKDWVNKQAELGVPITKASVDAFLASNGVAFGLNLEDFERQYTKLTQDKASDDQDIITLGTGDNIVFAGAGVDHITIGEAGDLGNNRVYAGDGDDILNINGLTTFVEAGGGADSVFLGDGTNEVYGWGKEFQNKGKELIDPTTGDWHLPNQPNVLGVDDQGDFGYDDGEVNEADKVSANGYNDDLTKIARVDGADLIVGGAGVDIIFGHYGADVIQGGLGDDCIHGGHDNDIVTGGIFEILDDTDTLLDLANETAESVRDSSLTVESAVHADDGADDITGAQGHDVLLGGSNADKISGGLGRDSLIGDYSAIHISSNDVAQRVTAKDMEAVGQGADILNGGGDSDLIVGGGESETIRDVRGDNLIIGDYATTEGADLASSITKVTSVASSFGKGDIINAGIGADMIFGNEGDDHINAGHGANFVAGDMAELDFATFATDGFAGSGRLTGILPTINGDDIIVSGLEADTIVAGGGADFVNASVEDFDATFTGASASFTPDDLTPAGFAAIDPGTDRNAVLGDNGYIVFDRLAQKDNKTFPIEQVQKDLDLTLSIENTVREVTGTMDAANDGDDEVVLGKGVDMVVLSGGGDEVTLGLAERYPVGPNWLDTTEPGQNYALGDGGTIRVELDDDDATTVSNDATKIITMETGADKSGGDDTITGDDDNDLVIGGGGADIIDVGEGDAGVGGIAANLVLGDSGTIVFNYLEDLGPILSTAVSQRDANDGDDTVTAGSGNDAIIFGGGGDEAMVAGGDNFIAGDGAVLDRINGTFESSTDTTGGDDTITTGAGRDIVLGGAAADVIDVGEGDNTVLSDSGQIEFDPVTLEPVLLTSRADTNDGDDEVTAGAGDDGIILGGGDDTATTGVGDNRAIGDSGYIRSGAGGLGSMATTDPSIGGKDVIGAGIGNDLLIGGVDQDIITVDGGDNVLHGDGALFTFVGDPYKNEIRSLSSVGSTNGGDDVLTTGEGDDLVVGGLGGDTITTNGGEDIAAGDWVSVDYASQSTGDHTLRSTDVSNFGNDTIDTGDGNDIAVGGDGMDEIAVGAGEDMAAGDDTAVGFTNNTDVEAITIVNNDNGGDDTITAAGAGDNILIGNAGADTIQGADEDDTIIGESATWTFIDFDDGTPGQSAQDRIATATANDTALAFNDVLIGGDGRDIIGGGFGNDLIHGEGGDDFLFGDGFIYTNNQDGMPDAEDGTSRFETNFAFEPGGDDVLTGGAGNDVMFGGLGGDGFAGNTEEDFIFDDSGSADTENWKILTVNYPGAEPVGVISGSQLGSSVGLDLTKHEIGLSSQIFDILNGAPTASGALTDGMDHNFEFTTEIIEGAVQYFLSVFIEYVSSSSFLESIYRVVLNTPVDVLDVEALLAQFRLDLYRYLLASKPDDLTAVDMLVIDQIVETRLRAVIETIVDGVKQEKEGADEAGEELQVLLKDEGTRDLDTFAEEIRKAASAMTDPIMG